ncbi:MAG: acyl-CoA thioesterase [Treponema sp.]|nr:acyl-CoA thioesterase [Treponema sp.]
MNVVYHGNYVKFLEVARCNLLDKIGYGYNEMVATKFMFPIATMSLKYIHSLQFEEEAIVKATLVEWENRIRIKYEIRSLKTGQIVTKAETTQIAVKMPEAETLFVCPKIFTEKVEAIIRSA